MRYDDTRILSKPFLNQVFQESSLSRYVRSDRKSVSPLPSLRFATLPIVNERIPCCLSTPFACLTTPSISHNSWEVTIRAIQAAPCWVYVRGPKSFLSLLEHQLFHVVHRSSRLQTLSYFTCQRTSAAFSSTTWVLSNGRVNFENHNLNKPLAKNERYVADLSLLREFWWNQYAHVILTAGADSLSTDAKHLLEDYGLVGCHSTKGNFMSVHARIDSTGHVRLPLESNDEEDKGSRAAIF